MLAYVSGYIFVCMCMFLYVYVFTKGCIFVSLSVCAGRVSCVLVCRRPWMLSRLQLGTVMVHVQCRKEQEQATYRLNGHTLKTSTFTLASSSMSSRAMKQAIDTRIVLGCQSEQEKGIFRFIWILAFFQMNCIRLVWLQCKVTIVFTVFKLAPSPPYMRTEGNCSNKVQHARTPRPAPSPSRRYIKQTKWTTAEPVTPNNKKHNRTHSEAVSLVSLYPWAISLFCNYVAC